MEIPDYGDENFDIRGVRFIMDSGTLGEMGPDSFAIRFESVELG
jgi:hypothetical protein